MRGNLPARKHRERGRIIPKFVDKEVFAKKRGTNKGRRKQPLAEGARGPDQAQQGTSHTGKLKKTEEGRKKDCHHD